MDPLALDDPNTEEKAANEDESKEVSLWVHEPLSKIPIKVLRGHTDMITSCHFCFNDTRILTCSYDKSTKVWDVETGAQLYTIDGGQSAITGCFFLPEKKRIITASLDRTLKAWDLETGQILWTATQGGLLTSCSASGDGKYVASTSDMEHALYLNCADTGQRLHYMKGHHKSSVTRCCFDPQSDHLASVSADRTIRLWDLSSHKTTLTINSTHTNVISNCCFSSDGRQLCTASWDRTLQLWDVKTGVYRTKGAVDVLKGHDGSVSSCAFSNDSALLVSGAYDRSVAIWDMTGPCRTLQLKGHTDWVTDVAISADKNWVASSSKDATIRLWNIEQSEQIPSVIETRRTQGAGFQILECEECGKPFSLSRLENSGLITKCVFCRLRQPTRYIPAPPSL